MIFNLHLQQTRIGRYVNELRKKTKDDQLAKRAKKLVRNWQKLVNQPDNGAVNGEKDGNTFQNNVIHRGLNTSCPNSPAVSQKLVSPALNKQLINTQKSSLPSKSGISSRPSTPSSQGSSKPNTPKIQTPGLPPLGHPKCKPNTPNLPSSQQQLRGRIKPNTPNLSQYSKTGLSPHLGSYVASPKLHSTPKSLNSPKVSASTNSVQASPVVSPLSVHDRPSTPLSGGSGSRPHTPVTSSVRVPSGHLPHNVSHENLSNFSMHSNASAEDREDSRSNHSNELSPIFTTTPSNSVKPDQSLNVKTNVANKKRSREDQGSGNNVKVAKVQHGNGHNDSVYKTTLNGSVQSGSSDSSADMLHMSTPTTKRSAIASKRNANLPVRLDSTPVLERSSSLTSKTPKVKTTAQLIADLQAKSGSKTVGSSVIKQIESNQIHKELDEKESVLPPGVKKKKRKKNSDSFTDSTPQKSRETLSRTKTELVEKFLQSSVPHQPDLADDISVRFDIACLGKTESQVTKDESSIDADITTSSHGETSFRPAEVKTDEHDSGTGAVKDEEPPTQESVIKPKILTLEEVYDMLPPINYDNVIVDEDNDDHVLDINETTTDIVSAGPTVDLEQAIPRLHSEHWESVNGNLNANDTWCDWTQTLSRTSYDGNLLHILPYILTDD